MSYYNYDETELVEYMIGLYENDSNIELLYEELKKIIYSIIINNDLFENLLDIINENGGVGINLELYNNIYKNTNILDIDIYNRLQFYELLAFIALFDKIKIKVNTYINNNPINEMDTLSMFIASCTL